MELIKGQTNQWNRRQSLEIGTHMSLQLIFDKVVNPVPRRKEFSTNGAEAAPFEQVCEQA